MKKDIFFERKGKEKGNVLIVNKLPIERNFSVSQEKKTELVNGV
jgi:hypothetical protein